MITFSSVTDRKLNDRRGFLYVVATPYALFRIIALMIVDIVRERRASRRARKDGVQPLGHRGGIYPLLRAATTVGLAEITWSVLVADVVRGVPSAYADLVGYDEVAHHSGIAAPDALDTLSRIDDQLERLAATLDEAPRPYYLVVLADHGQTQGATFEQRYGEEFGEVVRRLTSARSTAPVLAEEGWNNVNGLLTDAANDGSTLGKIVKRTTRTRTEDGEVVLGPDSERPTRDRRRGRGGPGVGKPRTRVVHQDPRASDPATDRDSASRLDRRASGATRESASSWFATRSTATWCWGSDGIHHLADGRIEGTDPLAVFGPNVADHIRRTSSFDNCPDLLVNSFYDPETDEGAAFEGLIGFHGGLGGKQSRPFVLAPAGLAPPPGPLIGAESIHHVVHDLAPRRAGSTNPRATLRPQGQSRCTRMRRPSERLGGLVEPYDVERRRHCRDRVVAPALDQSVPASRPRYEVSRRRRNAGPAARLGFRTGRTRRCR